MTLKTHLRKYLFGYIFAILLGIYMFASGEVYVKLKYADACIAVCDNGDKSGYSLAKTIMKQISNGLPYFYKMENITASNEYYSIENDMGVKLADIHLYTNRLEKTFPAPSQKIIFIIDPFDNHILFKNPATTVSLKMIELTRRFIILNLNFLWITAPLFALIVTLLIRWIMKSFTRVTGGRNNESIGKDEKILYRHITLKEFLKEFIAGLSFSVKTIPLYAFFFAISIFLISIILFCSIYGIIEGLNLGYLSCIFEVPLNNILFTLFNGDNTFVHTIVMLIIGVKFFPLIIMTLQKFRVLKSDDYFFCPYSMIPFQVRVVAIIWIYILFAIIAILSFPHADMTAEITLW